MTEISGLNSERSIVGKGERGVFVLMLYRLFVNWVKWLEARVALDKLAPSTNAYIQYQDVVEDI